MSRGTVKDPTGHQSKSYDFGYIQRTEGFSLDSQNQPVSILWPEDITAKVIPFLNKPQNPEDDTSRLHKKDDDLDFNVAEAHIIISTFKTQKDTQKAVDDIAGLTYQGTIGIAVPDLPKEEKVINSDA